MTLPSSRCIVETPIQRKGHLHHNTRYSRTLILIFGISRKFYGSGSKVLTSNVYHYIVVVSSGGGLHIQRGFVSVSKNTQNVSQIVRHRRINYGLLLLLGEHYKSID